MHASRDLLDCSMSSSAPGAAVALQEDRLAEAPNTREISAPAAADAPLARQSESASRSRSRPSCAASGTLGGNSISRFSGLAPGVGRRAGRWRGTRVIRPFEAGGDVGGLELRRRCGMPCAAVPSRDWRPRAWLRRRLATADGRVRRGRCLGRNAGGGAEARVRGGLIRAGGYFAAGLGAERARNPAAMLGPDQPRRRSGWRAAWPGRMVWCRRQCC